MEFPSSSEQQYCLRWNNHTTTLLSEFNELLRNEAFTDVTLVVHGGPSFIKCHKMVLAACSDYFSRLFARVSSIDHHPLIVLNDVKYHQMKAILEYMYQGKVSLAKSQLNDLLKVADFLEVKGLAGSATESISPQPAISSTERFNQIYNGENTTNGHTSPPHSTSSSFAYYPGYNKSNPQNPLIAAAAWNLSSLPLAAQSVMNTPMMPRAGTLFPGVYEADEVNLRKKMNNLMVNRDTPILRNVLGKGHADSSQTMTPNDIHEMYRSPSNESENEMYDGRRSSLDLSHGRNGHSPYAADLSMDGDEKKYSPQCAQANRKHKDWKRYKQYTKDSMDMAIDEVRMNKLTALKAANKYGIPSRTLYDKVKKMGIITQRNGRRYKSTTSSARFPVGMGGNRNGSIYNGMSNHDNEMMENSAALDMAYGHAPESSIDQENSSDNADRSPTPEEEIPRQEMEEPESDDHVQDLSVNRRNVIVPPPSTSIKEEKPETPQN